MTKVFFRHSEFVDFSRILDSLVRFDFYDKNKLAIVLPDMSDSIAKRIKANSFTDHELLALMSVVEFNYNKNKRLYYKTKNNLVNNWRKVEKRGFYERLNDLLKLDIPKEIVCYLSVWGSGGTEVLPDLIFIRVNSPKSLKSTNSKSIGRISYMSRVAYEIVELVVSPLQQKYSLEYRKYTRIINLILNDLKLFYKQSIVLDDFSVDATYYKHISKGIKEVFKNVS